MRFKIEGREYEWDSEHLTVEEAMVFQDKANIGIQELNPALLRGNPYATVTLIYLAKTRAGEAVRWQDLMNLDLATYEVLPPATTKGEDESAEDAPKKADPTTRSGRTRKGDTEATS